MCAALALLVALAGGCGMPNWVNILEYFDTDPTRGPGGHLQYYGPMAAMSGDGRRFVHDGSGSTSNWYVKAKPEFDQSGGPPYINGWLSFPLGLDMRITAVSADTSPPLSLIDNQISWPGSHFESTYVSIGPGDLPPQTVVHYLYSPDYLDVIQLFQNAQWRDVEFLIEVDADFPGMPALPAGEFWDPNTLQGCEEID